MVHVFEYKVERAFVTAKLKSVCFICNNLDKIDYIFVIKLTKYLNFSYLDGLKTIVILVTDTFGKSN